MRTFPIFLDLEGGRVVVVGGGEQAAQKVRLLLKTPARIDVIHETLCDELSELAKCGRIGWRRVFVPGTLDDCRLVYAAADAETNARVAHAANARNMPINVVDDPALCTFQTPAIVDRVPVVIAIGTEGTAPVLARQIRAHLESWLPPRLGHLAVLAGALRKHVNGRLRTDARTRRRFWELFFTGRTRALMLDGNEAGARAEAEALLDDGKLNAPSRGRVSLVGAGPGTADLMTLRALRRLQEADVIVHDRLIDPSVLDCARRDARRIDVGKTPGQVCIAQAGINEILIAEAKAGNDVVRLKGGDPMIFGRIGEEMAALDAAGISFDIVPGVTSATACAAEANIALTHRDEVRSVVFLTGHSTGGVTAYDWTALARPGTVFALYMAVSAAPRIQASLLAVGVPADTPVAIVEKGCSSASRTVHATLAGLERSIHDNKISNPAMLFVRYAMTGADQASSREPFESSVRRSIESERKNPAMLLSAGMPFGEAI
jgi:uroporphyrin-III C-methyltransferase/precorrin-2 dehydrogenase/sirohydrochlorin ferrochelatase